MLSSESVFGKDADVTHDLDFQLLLLVNVVGVLGVSLVSPLLDSLTGPFGVSPIRVGLFVSMFTAPPILGIPVAGHVADRYGRKPVIVAGLLLFGGGGVGIAFTTAFEAALALRLVQGLGFGALLPIVITSLGDLYDGDREATAQGIRLSVSGLSQALFSAVAGVLVVVAWQYPFLLYGLALPIAVLVQLRFREPSTHLSDRGREAADGGSTRGVRELLRLASRRNVAAVLMARGLPSLIWYGFYTYNSIILVRLVDGTPQQAGAVVAAASVVYSLAASQAGRITAASDSRLYPLVAAHVCLAIGLVVLAFARSFPVAGAGASVMGVGLGISQTLYRSIITGLAPTAQRGGLVSIGESWGRVTATLSPVVMGLLVGALTPLVGFAPAVRWTCLVVAVVGGGGGIALLLVARRASADPAPNAA